MKSDPSRASMERYAHLRIRRICPGTQDGGPPPRGRWRTDAPGLVSIGENSEPYFSDGARNLAGRPAAWDCETLPRQDHAAPWMAPEAVVATHAASF